MSEKEKTHFTIDELAKLWKVKPGTIRRLLLEEFDDGIPAAIVKRIYRRCGGK